MCIRDRATARSARRGTSPRGTAPGDSTALTGPRPGAASARAGASGAAAGSESGRRLHDDLVAFGDTRSDPGEGPLDHAQLHRHDHRLTVDDFYDRGPVAYTHLPLPTIYPV